MREGVLRDAVAGRGHFGCQQCCARGAHGLSCRDKGEVLAMNGKKAPNATSYVRRLLSFWLTR
jgi:hypothetical protein